MVWRSSWFSVTWQVKSIYNLALEIHPLIRMYLEGATKAHTYLSNGVTNKDRIHFHKRNCFAISFAAIISLWLAWPNSSWRAHLIRCTNAKGSTCNFGKLCLDWKTIYCFQMSTILKYSKYIELCSSFPSFLRGMASLSRVVDLAICLLFNCSSNHLLWLNSYMIVQSWNYYHL